MAELPFPPTAAALYSRAMFDAKPTTTITSQKQLAYALGYPMDWRVERTVTTVKNTGKPIIRDRIHALGGKKNKKKFMWLHHEAAQKAAAIFAQEGGTLTPASIIHPGGSSNNTADAKDATGSHLLPPTPLYAKGNVIQVRYERKWWEATVTKRKKKDDEFFYSVFYTGENSTQDDVAEEDIRPGENPEELAVSLGFTSDWKASRKGARYILISPTGETFSSKNAAMKVFNELQGKVSSSQAEEDVGDPPWRLEGHELIGKEIIWTFEHTASATRRIQIDQIGTITGYIDSKDKDRNGNPGFVSESTGKPANLFRVVFDDVPSHPYASNLLDIQDFEEWEIQDKVITTGDGGDKKRKANTDDGPKQQRRQR